MKTIAKFYYDGREHVIVKAEEKADFDEYEDNGDGCALNYYEGEDCIENYDGTLPALFLCIDNGYSGYYVTYATKQDLIDSISGRKNKLFEAIKTLDNVLNSLSAV